jgi:hypothetical protein
VTPRFLGAGGFTAPVPPGARLLLKSSSGPALFCVRAEECGVSHFSFLPASPLIPAPQECQAAADHRSTLELRLRQKQTPPAPRELWGGRCPSTRANTNTNMVARPHSALTAGRAAWSPASYGQHITLVLIAHRGTRPLSFKKSGTQGAGAPILNREGQTCPFDCAQDRGFPLTVSSFPSASRQS